MLAVMLAGAIVLASSPVGARTSASVTGSGGSWGKAKEVPGTATLNQGGDAQVSSVSCASAGNCSAGGFYASSFSSGLHALQAFVVSQVNGKWGKAEEVPGTATLNVHGEAEVSSLSCGSAGNCSAGGYYTDSSGQHGFVVSQVNDKWGKAEEVRGSIAILSVSCASAGNCSAGGYDATQALVVSQINGTWGKAKEVPGTAALNQGSDAQVYSVSCASAGNCSAGGFYASSYNIDTGALTLQAFVVSQVNGTWGKGKEVPGTAALNTGGTAAIGSVSCASAGNCSAGGYYNAGASLRPFLVSQVNGTWGKAEEVPHGLAINSVSCAPAGNCSAGGDYTPTSSRVQAVVVSQVNGTWGKAEEVPGTGTLNIGGEAWVGSVSCASAGNCSAGGIYTGTSSHHQVFVVSQVNGTWGKAEEVPGTETLNPGGGFAIQSVSCASAGNCSAGGDYYDSSGIVQAFVVSQVNGTLQARAIRRDP
jgi:hypothetical protein